MACLGLLALLDVQVVGEHLHELIDGGVGHGAVVQWAGTQGFAPQALHAAIEPVEHRQIGLAHPAVTPAALEEGHQSAVAHHVVHQHGVVIHPHLVEVVEGILHAAPLTVLVKAGLVTVQVAQTALAVRLAVPEVLCQLLIVHVLGLGQGAFQVDLFHQLFPPWIFLISTLSINAWKRVRS